MLQNATSTNPKGGTTRIYSIGGTLEDLLGDAQRVLPFASDRLDLYGFPGQRAFDKPDLPFDTSNTATIVT
jgi:hypothetical protein